MLMSMSILMSMSATMLDVGHHVHFHVGHLVYLHVGHHVQFHISEFNFFVGHNVGHLVHLHVDHHADMIFVGTSATGGRIKSLLAALIFQQTTQIEIINKDMKFSICFPETGFTYLKDDIHKSKRGGWGPCALRSAARATRSSPPAKEGSPPHEGGGPSCTGGRVQLPHSNKLTCPPRAHVYYCGNRNVCL